MNIYFICTGNTCRSPMAAAILQAKNYENITVRSAGIYAHKGNEMSLNAKEILHRKNISQSHRSSQFTVEDAQWADLILTMTTAHKEMVLRLAGEAAHKTFTLKEYVEMESLDIQDPFGGNLQVYEQTYEQLNEAINKLETKLKLEDKI
ncbi:low molecular weight protein arginine phosphatase [Solibacillus sp. FSL R5-0449]|uniref:low molecular weight protein arginine phosphatase n=1 Tax=Solibacillus sp. FSL R5-0449 TaxID=2921639 RepID=UPI0030CF621C